MRDFCDSSLLQRRRTTRRAPKKRIQPFLVDRGTTRFHLRDGYKQCRTVLQEHDLEFDNCSPAGCSGFLGVLMVALR